MLRATLVCVAAFCCLSLIANTHPVIAQPEKKADANKGQDDTSKSTKDNKAKSSDKSGESAKDKSKTPLEQIRFPGNTIIVVVDDLLKAGAMVPKQWIVPLEEWLALQERVKTLEQQLKGERVLPSSCKLTGEIKNDFLVFRGDYVFATGPGKTVVPLGLQGGHLIKEGRLDKQSAILDIDKDEGFLARIDKEGNPHRLSVEFRVPIKKAQGGGVDRSIDLGLPLAAGTTLDLTLPAGVRELRWNGNIEKPIAPGRWQIGLERTRTLNLAWKEPLPPSGNAPLAKVESQIKVDVDASQINITADIFVEDRRLRTEEWLLHLPGQAKVETVKAPAGLNFTLEEKPGQAVLRVPVSSDRWQITVSQRIARPAAGTKVPIGPFVIQGAFQSKGAQQVVAAFEHHGTITIKMPAEASLGQRLVFTRGPAVTQTKNTEAEAAFHYVMPAAPDKGPKTPAPKAPLEMEWRFDKNQLRTRVDHDVRIQATQQGWEIDATTRIHVTALFSTINIVDLKLPPLRPHGMLVAGAAAPALSFPASLPWGSLWTVYNMPWVYHGLDEFNITDDAGSEFKLLPQDASGKTRASWTRGSAKELTLVLKSTLRAPLPVRRIRLDLPRTLGTQDRGAKLSLHADDHTELLYGPEGAEEPAPGRDHFDLTWDSAPAWVDVAWRPYQREIVTESTIDVEVYEHSARVVQVLRFPRVHSTQAADAKNLPVQLKVPRGVDKVTLLSDGELTHNRGRDVLWFRPGKEVGDSLEMTLQYHVPIRNKLLNITPIWPEHASHEDVKVRVWTPAGVQPRLAADLVQRGVWKERSIEIVKDKDQFPALVLASFGSKVPLILTLEDTASTTLAALLAERALVQVRMEEDGSQQVQARYLVTKINAPTIDVELPVPLAHFRDPPAFFLGNYQITQVQKVDAAEKVLRVQLPATGMKTPIILKITYSIPTEALERCNFWSTKLHAPVLGPTTIIGQTRWQLATPLPMIAASFGHTVRADTEWSVQGWLLTPQPSGSDWEAWLTGRESRQPGPSVTFAFADVGAQGETVYHLPRSWWLLSCSGLFLLVTLGAYFAPLPRWMFWFLLALMSLAMAIFTLLCPAAWAAVAFGLQPGLVLFLIFTGAHRFLQERYRRQLVFMPGFTRAKAGSTITRATSAKRPREASTVDAPPGSADSAQSSSTPSGT